MSDLPGFYYDAEKRRYFRLLPGSNRNNPLTLDKIKVKECQGAGSSGAGNSKKKARPVHQALFHQQINGPQMDGSLNLQERIIKSKLDSMSEKEDASLDLLDFCGNKLSDVVCENFIGVPEKNAVYGVWHGSNGTSVYRLSVRDKIHGKPDPSQALAIDAEQSLINCFPPGNQVMDFAVTRGLDSEPDSVFCLTSHLKTNNKVSSSLGIQFIKQDERRSGCFGTGHSVRFEFPNVLYSCAGGRTLFAIGGDKQIRLFSPTSRHYTSPYSGFCDQNTLAVDDGKVTSLKLTEDNSKLLAGTNKGEFYVFDPKTTNKISFALFSRSIVYCHVLK
ncbi:hypothetical protein HDE_11868 [Halotydeus destructor]|nr:hypothetical protein HDE_11868 [Halotydeus destructor]